MILPTMVLQALAHGDIMKPNLPVISLAALLLTPPAALHATDFVVVAPDMRPAPIVVFKDAPPRTRDAAVTLAEYIERVSGDRPQLIDGEPQPVPERAIWVGAHPVVKSLFPQIDLEFQHLEETLIAANKTT